ncbi:MAG: hypothetical protein ACRC14_05255 [Paracoccaceae bacterium]
MTTTIHYRTLPPASGEARDAYAYRLQQAGHEEMFIRKALRFHFAMKIDELPALFVALEPARLRHIALLATLQPGRTDYSLARKLSKNLGISIEIAEQMVAKFKALKQPP